MSDKRKTKWSTYTPEQKTEHIRKMQEGRLKKKESKEVDGIVGSIVEQIKEKVEVTKRKRGRPRKDKEGRTQESVYVPIEVVVDNIKVFEVQGKKYRKIGRHDVIETGALHTLNIHGNVGEFQTLKNPNSIGQSPYAFDKQREFYNPIGG